VNNWQVLSLLSSGFLVGWARGWIVLWGLAKKFILPSGVLFLEDYRQGWPNPTTFRYSEPLIQPLATNWQRQFWPPPTFHARHSFNRFLTLTGHPCVLAGTQPIRASRSCRGKISFYFFMSLPESKHDLIHNLSIWNISVELIHQVD